MNQSQVNILFHEPELSKYIVPWTELGKYIIPWTRAG